MLEKLTEWSLVKFFGSFINSDALGDRLAKILSMYENNSFMAAAKKMFAWAVVITIVATAVDLTFYWLRPEQKETLMKVREHLIEFKERLSDKNHDSGRLRRR